MSGWESNWNRMIWKTVIKMYLCFAVRCRRVGTMKQLRIFNVTLCDYSAPTDRRKLVMVLQADALHLRAYVMRTELRIYEHCNGFMKLHLNVIV